MAQLDNFTDRNRCDTRYRVIILLVIFRTRSDEIRTLHLAVPTEGYARCNMTSAAICVNLKRYGSVDTPTVLSAVLPASPLHLVRDTVLHWRSAAVGDRGARDQALLHVVHEVRIGRSRT